MLEKTGRIVVHRGRAHVDDFLASCVCVHKTGLPLFRQDADEGVLDDPSCWVLDQGMRFEPELLNFDHHHTDDEICAFTMVLDHLYGASCRDYFPQLRYVEIYDSHGASKAAKFAGAPREALDISASLVQQFVLRAFSSVEGEVGDDFIPLMRKVGGEICDKIESMPVMMESLDRHSKIEHFMGLEILDITLCEGQDLPTKAWSSQRNLSPDAILAKDPRLAGSLRLIAVDRSRVNFRPDPSCSFVHPSGFLAVFPESEDWRTILSKTIVPG
jgi:hypothetical protein